MKKKKTEQNAKSVGLPNLLEKLKSDLSKFTVTIIEVCRHNKN